MSQEVIRILEWVPLGLTLHHRVITQGVPGHSLATTAASMGDNDRQLFIRQTKTWMAGTGGCENVNAKLGTCAVAFDGLET
jgi:hypothetical protein